MTSGQCGCGQARHHVRGVHDEALVLLLLAALLLLLLAGLSLISRVQPRTATVGPSVALLHTQCSSSGFDANVDRADYSLAKTETATRSASAHEPDTILLAGASSAKVASVSLKSTRTAVASTTTSSATPFWKPSASALGIPPYAITAENGLTNRLYALLSFIDGAHSEDRGLVVHWIADEQCPGNFSSVFEPDALPPDVKVLATPSQRNTLHTGWLFPYKPRPDLGRLALAYLRPTAAVQARIDALLAALGWPTLPFSALHLRHTDMDTTFPDHQGTSDAEAIAWAAMTDGPLYVAADNGASLSLLQSAFPGRVFSGSTHLLPSSVLASSTTSAPLRHTSLADAVVDMWVASYSSDFMGTAGSSFSEQIGAMRRSRGALKGSWFCNQVRNASRCHGEPQAGGEAQLSAAPPGSKSA